MSSTTTSRPLLRSTFTASVRLLLSLSLLLIRPPGRTGRAGHTGEAITFYTERDIELLRAIANVVRNSGGEAADWMLRATPKLTQRRKKQLAHSQVDRKRISTLPHHQKQRRKRANPNAEAEADAASE